VLSESWKVIPMDTHGFEAFDRAVATIEASRRRLRWLRWCWLAVILVLYAGWDAFDTMILNRLDPILGGFLIDWGVITALGAVLTVVISQWQDHQLAQTAERFARSTIVERAAIQLEAAQVTARGIAHNLNQPLAAIRGYAELLHDAPADAQAATDLWRIIAETDRAAAMVRQLLQLTRYETTPYAGGAPMIDLERATNQRRAQDTSS
jgi:signal transduction histidine kinase